MVDSGWRPAWSTQRNPVSKSQTPVVIVYNYPMVSYWKQKFSIVSFPTSQASSAYFVTLSLPTNPCLNAGCSGSKTGLFPLQLHGTCFLHQNLWFQWVTLHSLLGCRHLPDRPSALTPFHFSDFTAFPRFTLFWALGCIIFAHSFCSCAVLVF